MNSSGEITSILNALHMRVSALESMRMHIPAKRNGLGGETTLPYGSRAENKMIKLYNKFKYDPSIATSPWEFLTGSETKITGLGWSNGIQVHFEIHWEDNMYVYLRGLRGSFDFYEDDAEYPVRCATIKDVIEELNRDFELD